MRGYFYAWRDSGLLATINQFLVMAAREIEGRQAQPTAGIIDSQSVKTTESGGICGYDAGKKIKGRKRHIITDTLGLPAVVRVHGAYIEDRDGAPDLLRAIRFRHPSPRHVFADGGYAGDKLKDAMREHNVDPGTNANAYCWKIGVSGIVERSYDYVIVGGGSAGCVLAARLSEDPGTSVLLLEAGRDTDPGEPALLSRYPARAYFDPANVWPGLTITTGGVGANDPSQRPRAAYAQARILGGGSSINGIGANRGAPSDYDEWEAAGAAGWNWGSVLPAFKALERDLDHGGEAIHGTRGAIPVRRLPQEDWAGFATRVVGELGSRGVPFRPDQNGEWADGVYPTALNLDERWERVSTARGYLDRSVRDRSNLTIRTDTQVRRVIVREGRAVGVEVGASEHGRGIELVSAREVVVCAGAIHTPALLMRSGLGPAWHLAEVGVEPLIDLPAVGQNLLEHPSAGIVSYLPRRSRLPHGDGYHIPAIYRFSSGLDGCPAGDMHMAIVGRAAWHAVGRRMGLLFFWVNKSYSRGRVLLSRNGGGGAAGSLDVDMRMLEDERDKARLADAFRLSASILNAVHADGTCGPPMPARLSERARRFGHPTSRNRIATGLAGLLLDAAGPFGPQALHFMAGGNVETADLLADEAALRTFLDESAVGVWHACGTCRMGAAGDRHAVTDSAGRVRGVESLRVCDASLFPTIPCANINIPVVMVAERIAMVMKAGR